MTAQLLTVPELVEQLVRRFSQEWPTGHRCTKDGRHVCTHHRLGDAPLLMRIGDLIEPGTTFTERSGAKPQIQGSPAPWDPRAAELVDEILRGAVRRVDRARRVLGLEPFTVSVTRAEPQPLDSLGYDVWLGYGKPRYKRRRMLAAAAPISLAGTRALLALPGLLVRLQEVAPDHPLVRGELLVPSDPTRGHRLGDIETGLRSWHAAAVRVAGYEELPPIRWAWLDNPLPHHWGNEVSSWSGPMCPAAYRPAIRRKGSHRYRAAAAAEPLRWEPATAQVACGHSSCLRIAYAAMGARVPAWCPWCWRRTLVEDQESGVVRCTSDHPHYVGPVEWATRAAAVESLQASLLGELGIDIDGDLVGEGDGDDAACTA